ncbi:MAG: hypothetical protein HXY45_19515 [Syntrophaceae bacterium]|nr:hypothetical protein [Syntrophaceae bacterium]
MGGLKRIIEVLVFGLVLFVALGNLCRKEACGDEKPQGYLKPPPCGTFGPTEELMSNPGVLWTHMSGGSASHILYPYLAGCAPREWRVTDDTGDPGFSDIQGFLFNEEGKSFAGYWKRTQTVNGKTAITFNSVNFMEYDPRGYVKLHSYRCDRPGTDAWEVMVHDYDDQGRQVRQHFVRPAGCFSPKYYDPPMILTWRFSYGDKRFPQLPTRVTMEYEKPEPRVIGYDLEYVTDEKERIVKVKRKYSPDRVEEDTYRCDERGKIVQARKPGREGAVQVPWDFAYEETGRLSAIRRGDGFQFQFKYRPDGQVEELVSPTPHYNPVVHRDRKNRTFKAIYQSDIKQPILHK